MTSHLTVKIRAPEEFRKAREWLKSCALQTDESAIFFEALEVYEDFNNVMREKNISIDNLRDAAFGSGTEKPQTLFDNVINIDSHEDSVDDAPEAQNPRKGSNRKHRRKGHGRRNFKLHAHAQVTKCSHEHLKAGELCPACEAGKLHHFKPKTKTCISAVNLFVVQVFELESLRCGSCQEITSAAEPAEVKSCYGKYHASAIATLAVLRYAFGMPSYRLADLSAIQGLEISDATQFRLFELACLAAAPVLKLLAKTAANSKILFRDDSPMRVNNLKRELQLEKQKLLAKGENADSIRVGITTTAIHARTQLGHSITLYATGTEHAGEVYDDLLKMRTLTEKIMAMADAASLNRDHSHEAKTIELGCNTHARRNFYRLRHHYPGEVEQVLDLFAHVYHVDNLAKDKKLTPLERLEFHKQESTSVMHMLFVMSRIKRMEHEENSSIWKAYQYLENHWLRLTAFLRYPGAELENSEAERSLKWAIRHRNNSLFYKTAYGAYVGDVLMSVIKTARDNGLNPISYLQDIVTNKDVVKKRPECWLPWNWKCDAQAVRKAS